GRPGRQAHPEAVRRSERRRAGVECAEDFSPKLIGRLNDSPELRARVETARRLGISLRRLNGWSPRRETTYEYDDKGRLVRSETWEEPEWNELERAYMLALAEWEAGRCQMCGGDPGECQSPD